jgi:hypothetical protein
MSKKNSIDFVETTIYYVRSDKAHFIKLSYPDGELIFPFHDSMVPVFYHMLGIELNHIDLIDQAVTSVGKIKVVDSMDFLKLKRKK